MSETLTKYDPFLNKEVEISNRLTDRLRGRYACGPTLPNGEPEFGWREFETPPIQKEAAAEIERLRDLLRKVRKLDSFTNPGISRLRAEVDAAISGASVTPDKG
jgi:hypothetical protein